MSTCKSQTMGTNSQRYLFQLEFKFQGLEFGIPIEESEEINVFDLMSEEVPFPFPKNEPI